MCSFFLLQGQGKHFIHCFQLFEEKIENYYENIAYSCPSFSMLMSNSNLLSPSTPDNHSTPQQPRRSCQKKKIHSGFTALDWWILKKTVYWLLKSYTENTIRNLECLTRLSSQRQKSPKPKVIALAKIQIFFKAQKI